MSIDSSVWFLTFVYLLLFVDGPNILAETMITQEGNLGNGIEPRIYIETNIQQSDSSDSDNSSDSEDGCNEANRDDALNELEGS